MKKIIYLGCLLSLYGREIDYSLINLPKTDLEYSESRGEFGFGTGFNSFTGKASGSCVTFQQIHTLGNGKNVTLETKLITSQNDLYKSLSIEASAQARFGLNPINAKTKFAEGIAINDYSFFVMAKVEVLNAESLIQGESLTPWALDLLKANNKEAFLNKCGNEFVKAINQGASLYVLFEIKTHSLEERNSIYAQLSGHLGVFSSEINFSKSLKELIKDRQVKFKYLQSGGVIGDPREQEEVINYVVSFPSKVNKENMVPQKARTASYQQLIPIEFLSSAVIAHQFDVLNYLANKRIHYLHALANYEYLMRHSGEALPEYLKEREKIVELLNKTASFAHRCGQNMADCIYPLELTDVATPEGTLDVSCEFREAKVCGLLSSELVNDGHLCGFYTEIAAHQSCGVETYNEGQDAICLKYSENPVLYKMGHGPQCGVFLYNERRAGICGWVGNGWLGKLRAKKCRHISFGVERYNSCRHQDFGIEEYPTCRDAAFGVETYKSCPITLPKTCEIKKFKPCWVTYSILLKDFDLCPLLAIPL